MKSLTLPQPKLSQGTIVVGTLMGAWVLWLAAQNKLVVYWQLLLGQYSGTGSTTSNPTVPSAPGSNITSQGASAPIQQSIVNTPALGGTSGTGYSPPDISVTGF